MSHPHALFSVEVLTPDFKSSDRKCLQESFILVAKLPRTVQFLSVISLPNILDVMGMPSGGGPPGFSVLIPKLSDEEPKQYPVNRIIAGYAPEAEMKIPMALGLHIGTSTSAGIVLNWFEIIVDEEARTASFEEVSERFLKNGYRALKLVKYTTPSLLAASATT